MNTVSTALVAQSLGVSPRAVQLRAKRENWPVEKQGRTQVYDVARLPSEVQSQLRESPVDADQRVLLEAREKDRTLVLMRAGLIGEFRRSTMKLSDFLEAYNLGAYPAPYAILGEVNIKTFYRWQSQFISQGLTGLLPKWSLKKETSRNSLSQVEKDYLKTLYLDQKKWSVAHCYDRLKEAFTHVASYSTVRRYLTQDLDKGAVAYWRDGPTKHRDEYMGYINRDPEAWLPMEQVQSDHHHLDFFINVRGKLVRPWLTVMVDYFSGKILSWVVSLNPCSATIAMAYAKMVLQYGAPVGIHTDNGKDYLAKALTGGDLTLEEDREDRIVAEGLYAICGSNLILATPYNGKSKGRTERLFGTFAERLSKEFPTYCGSDTKSKPEQTELFFRSIKNLPKTEVSVSFEDVVAVVDRFIPLWNAKWVGEAKGRNGRTADEVFASKPSVGRQVPLELMEVHFGAPLVRTVNRLMVTLNNQTFYDIELGRHAKEKVLVRRLWHDPQTVVVQDLEGRFICRARAGVNNETEDLEEVRRRIGVDAKILTHEARALKPKGIESKPEWYPKAAGAEHLDVLPTLEKKPTFKLKNPLDEGYED